MIPEIITRRSDEQLEFLLCETANWTVNGAHGVDFHEVASPRPAIEKATQLAARGREVVALMRTRPPEIVVSWGQGRNLTNPLVESQVSPWPHIAVVIIDTADGCDGPLSALIPNGAVYREAIVYNAM